MDCECFKRYLDKPFNELPSTDGAGAIRYLYPKGIKIQFNIPSYIRIAHRHQEGYSCIRLTPIIT